MSVPMVCPSCHAILRATEIPLANRGTFSEATHFSRVIGIYDEQADATVAWMCPDCRHEWARTEDLPSGLRSYELVSRGQNGPSSK
jgi:hypothetical protein